MRRGCPCQTLREDPRNTNNRVSAGKSKYLTFSPLKNTGRGCTTTQRLKHSLRKELAQMKWGPVAPGEEPQEEARKSLQFSTEFCTRWFLGRQAPQMAGWGVAGCSQKVAGSCALRCGHSRWWAVGAEPGLSSLAPRWPRGPKSRCMRFHRKCTELSCFLHLSCNPC